MERLAVLVCEGTVTPGEFAAVYDAATTAEQEREQSPEPEPQPEPTPSPERVEDKDPSLQVRDAVLAKGGPTKRNDVIDMVQRLAILLCEDKLTPHEFALAKQDIIGMKGDPKKLV